MPWRHTRPLGIAGRNRGLGLALPLSAFDRRRRTLSGPKTFISYSWTSPLHEQWVMDLATQLVEKGVRVVLDKWDLREGHDALQFMEAMVVDPDVTKVIVISDKHYADKADKRRGGVGTESQIMSPEIYKKADQTKFVAVLPELDTNGEPCLPAFLRSRMYIDMSSDDRYATNFEQLLRWLYDKPTFVKPPLGSPPEFTTETSETSALRSNAKRAVGQLKAGTLTASRSVDDYFSSLIGIFKSFRISPGTPDFGQAVLDSVAAFLPHRDQFIEVIFGAAPDSNSAFLNSLQKFFEGVIPFMSKPPLANSWRDTDFDNYAFIIHELFLYVVGILLRHEEIRNSG